MSNSLKKQINLRLKETVIKELHSLSAKYHVSQADVVAVLVHWLYADGEDLEKLEDAFNTVAII